MCKATTCDAVLELPLARLRKALPRPAACPVCGAEFYTQTVPDPFGLLVDALEALDRVNKLVQLELVAPVD
jgi:hypothetical protein